MRCRPTDAKAVVVGEECLDNLLATDGLPDVPWWLIEDLENPHARVLPACVDQSFSEQIAQAAPTPLPVKCAPRLRLKAPRC